MTGKVVLITVTTRIIFIREARTRANSASEVPIRNFFQRHKHGLIKLLLFSVFFRSFVLLLLFFYPR